MSSRILLPETARPPADGVDRRGFLKCMAWAGTGVLWAMKGGILTGCTLDRNGAAASSPTDADFTFLQFSDSHIGFSRAPNQDVVGTMREAIRRANTTTPALLLHTGDLTHDATPEEFDTVAQLIGTVKTERAFYVPGEHDVFYDGTNPFLDRYGNGTLGDGWHSFDYRGVHFIGLVNVMSNGENGFGQLGDDQLDWLKKDLIGRSDSTPIVVFAHMPLWTVYERWGWGTQDSGAALQLLRRFGSVTVLNGHIHQVLQKIEGNITFHTARSTAFPQPAPGSSDKAGPMQNIAAEKLRSMLGITSVRTRNRISQLAVIDTDLA